MTKWINKLPPEGIKACKAELRGLGLNKTQIKSCFNSQKPVEEYELILMRTLKKGLQDVRDFVESAVMYGLIKITRGSA